VQCCFCANCTKLFTQSPQASAFLRRHSRNLPAFNVLLDLTSLPHCRYMGDLKRDERTSQDLARSVVRRGVDIPELRDEIYCQLCKQLIVRVTAVHTLSCAMQGADHACRGYMDWLSVFLCLSASVNTHCTHRCSQKPQPVTCVSFACIHSYIISPARPSGRGSCTFHLNKVVEP
jgi:MyTH4 domain-containing protein